MATQVTEQNPPISETIPEKAEETSNSSTSNKIGVDQIVTETKTPVDSSNKTEVLEETEESGSEVESETETESEEKEEPAVAVTFALPKPKPKVEEQKVETVIETIKLSTVIFVEKRNQIITIFPLFSRFCVLLKNI